MNLSFPEGSGQPFAYVLSCRGHCAHQQERIGGRPILRTVADVVKSRTAGVHQRVEAALNLCSPENRCTELMDAADVLAKSALIEAHVLAVVAGPHTGRSDEMARPGVVARAPQVVGELQPTPEVRRRRLPAAHHAGAEVGNARQATQAPASDGGRQNADRVGPHGCDPHVVDAHARSAVDAAADRGRWLRSRHDALDAVHRAASHRAGTVAGSTRAAESERAILPVSGHQPADATV
jgi:hypothetical protein